MSNNADKKELPNNTLIDQCCLTGTLDNAIDVLYLLQSIDMEESGSREHMGKHFVCQMMIDALDYEIGRYGEELKGHLNSEQLRAKIKAREVLEELEGDS